MSSLKEVINLQKRQSTRYTDLKQSILDKLTEKITHLAKHGEMRCVYTVPSYTFGAPVYNVVDITAFLYFKFKKEGFLQGDRNIISSLADDGIDKNCNPVHIPSERNKINITALK